MSFTAVIPARWESSRFPGKPLAEVGGVPMVVRTASRALEAGNVGRVVVATDDRRIVDACAAYGLETVMTSSTHATGTDRIAEASEKLGIHEVVNVQGDEPLVEPAAIDTLVIALSSDPGVSVVNAACPLEPMDLENPNVVKAVKGRNDRLLFLSRLPIPFSWAGSIARFRHMGMYAFRGEALARYVTREQGPVELAERVEMYRFLEHGDPIRLVDLPPAPPAVDIPDDLARIEEYVSTHGGWANYRVCEKRA